MRPAPLWWAGILKSIRDDAGWSKDPASPVTCGLSRLSGLSRYLCNFVEFPFRDYKWEQMPHKYLTKEFEELAHSAPSPTDFMQRVTQRIHMHIPRYNWVGFYLVDKKDPSSLVLGPHTGSFTPSQRISFGSGLCGVSALTGQTVAANDVRRDTRYIPASDMVKSQIVTPLRSRNRVVGVFNLESYFMDTFKSTEDVKFVEQCAALAGEALDRTAAPNLVGV